MRLWTFGLETDSVESACQEEVESLLLGRVA